MKKIFTLLTLSLLILSCSDSNDPGGGGGGSPQITIDETPVGFPSTGGNQVLELKATGDWQVTGTTGWCKVSPMSGGSGTHVLTITVTPSQDLTEDQNTVIKIGDRSITVTQKKINALTLTQDKFPVPSGGGIINVEVNHNVDFTSIIPFPFQGWIEKVESKALPKTALQFNIKPSGEYEKRDGYIIIKDKASDLADTIRIYQAQKDALVLVDNNQTINNEGGLFSVELKTNVNYEISIEEDNEWIKKDPGTRSLRTDVAKFTVDPLDESEDNREVTITFKDRDSQLTDKVVLCQLADGALFLMKSKFEFDATGGIVYVKLKDMNFTTKVIAGHEWLTPIPFEEEIAVRSAPVNLKTDSIRFVVYSNYTYGSRTGKILVTDTETEDTDTITVFQSAKNFDTNTEMTTRLLWGSLCTRTDVANVALFHTYRNIILLTWRMLPNDTPQTAFDIYRQDPGGWVKLNSDAIVDRTNFQDKTADRGISNTYKLCYAGSETAIDTYTMPASGLPYFSISLKETASDDRLDAGATYQANDAGVADLDGDGVYEILIKRHSTGVAEESDDEEAGSSVSKSPVILEAYKMDGTFMWRVVFGPNMSNGNGTTFAAYDLDGDGKAEVSIRTSEGTYFGDGTFIGDTNGDGKTNYAEAGKYNSEAPEFISVLKGTTGEELARAPYIAIGTSEEWGDNYFKRANSLRLTVAKLKPGNASVVACRGVYNKMVLEAWDYNGPGQAMTKRWTFNTDDAGYSRYRGQGNHQLSVADVDADGFDEITYGACAIDHDGTGLYTTFLGHGDMLHVGDFDPTRAGLETFQCYEGGLTEGSLRDARTGKQLWASMGATTGDMGRGIIADIDPDSPGCEMWMYKTSLYSINGEVIGGSPGAANAVIWFGGSLNRQILDGDKIDQYKTGESGKNRLFTIYRYETNSINGSKKNVCFYGDFLGDWREEMILSASSGLELRIFSTWHPTDYKFPYLMSDHVYHMSAVNQNIGYNSPTQLGYYLGSDLIK